MREKKTCKRGLALLLTVMLMTALLPLAAMANSEGLTDQDQLATKDAEKFTRDEETGFFSKDESGEWLGIAASGHTFLAVKQGPWSLIWTPEELSSEEQAALWSAITTSSVQLSPGKKAYFVSGEGPFPVEENNAGTYYAAEVDGEVYLLSDAGKISHFYYGGFSFDDPTVTPDPETTATPDPAPTVTPSSKDSDPDPSVRPTPQPSTAPTVPPEVILTEEPVPEGSLPEGIIEEEKVPLASEPATLPEEEIEIIDEAIPLGNLPQTGSVAEAANPTVTVGILAVAFSLAAAGVYLSFGDKKEKEDG